MSDKYYRLVTLVVNICPKPVRELFITKAKNDTNNPFTNLTDYLNLQKPKIIQLRKRFKISDDQLANIYPAAQSVDINTWDLTLLSVLLREIFPGQLQQNERDCLTNITDIRNSLQHIASTEFVDEQRFNTAWSGLRDAIIELSKCTGASSLDNIEDEIKTTLRINKPDLEDVFKWNKELFVQLQLQKSELADEIKAIKEESKKSNKMFTKASVKRKGRSGTAEKRMKIVDNKVERMKERFQKALQEENTYTESFKDDISLITQQLIDNHRVIVTGYDNTLTYKCALASVQKRNYQPPDQCLEINNPSDWKRIVADDAQLVLFREPFGRAAYEPQKVEVMVEEFDTMLDATKENNDQIIDIVIVTNQRRLNEVITRTNEHEMLSPESTVYIDSSAGDNQGEEMSSEDTVFSNMLEFSKMYHQSYERKSVDRNVKSVADLLFLEKSAVTIVGPARSGKTGLSFDLLPSYDLSNGEENFVVVMNPGELKYVKFSKRPVILLKLFNGTQFDQMEANKWYRQFDRLHAAVLGKKAAVIIIIESKNFKKWKTDMPAHHLLDHVVVMPGTNLTEETNHGMEQQDILTDAVSSVALRSVLSIREYAITLDEEDLSFLFILGSCVLPSGEVFLIDYKKSILLKLDSDYNVLNICDLPGNPYGICYIGNNEAVVTLSGSKLQFVNTEHLTQTKTVYTDHNCNDVACHDNKLYVTDEDSVYVYSAKGEYQNVLYKADSNQTDEEVVFNRIAVSNDGGMIYIFDYYNSRLITVDNSGNYLYALKVEESEYESNSVCVDDKGYVYVSVNELGDPSSIVQISSDGRQNLGTLFEFDDPYTSITFDKEKSALMVTTLNSSKLKVLKLR